MRFLPLILLLAIVAVRLASPGTSEPLAQAQVQDTLQPKRDSAMNAVLRDIAGKEELPAKEVFANVTMLGEMPAGRFVRVMNQGYSRNLGVTCEYCHDMLDYGSDEKREKETARAMVRLVGTIAGELRQIPTIKSENPVVNCGTCHRGVARPGVRPGQ